jgi:putative tryptophan/tyrosine transport system substrate-binding protein
LPCPDPGAAMRRRDFITLLGGAAAWPRAAWGQPHEQKRRVAVLMGGLLSSDRAGQAEVTALEDGLTELGWKLGGNIERNYHWPGAELDQVSVAANEIAAMQPDLVVSRSTPATAAIVNRGVPVVFVLVADPIGSGFVRELGHPGGNVTGFSLFENSVGGKWLELLKEAAPAVTQISLLFNPATAPFAEGYLRSAQTAAHTLGATVIPAPCGSAADIEGAFAARAREKGGGIIVIFDTFLVEHRDLLVGLAIRHRSKATPREVLSLVRAQFRHRRVVFGQDKCCASR